jgi:hypothetical protein
MPKQNINYSNTIIYMIYCNNPDITDLYVGHTTNYVQKKYLHKQYCNNPKSSNYNHPLYQRIRETGGWSNWRVTIVDHISCENYENAILQERHYCALFNNTLNGIHKNPTILNEDPQIIPTPPINLINTETNVVESSKNHQILKDGKNGNYVCKSCDYSTAKKNNIMKHFTTKKHEIFHKMANSHVNKTEQLNSNIMVSTSHNGPSENEKVHETAELIDPPVEHLAEINCVPMHNALDKITQCDNCNKIYKSRNGLWKHKKVCNAEQPKIDVAIAQAINPEYAQPINDLLAASNQVLNANETLTNTVMDLIKQNQDLQKQLIEIAKEGRNTIINNTTNNSFNLRVYLNETCKDAVNMVDFVNSLHLQLSDLEETGKLGYSNGMSRIFINGLKDMDACKRPIHCSDLKRETLYIKEDDVWEKDNEERDRIKKAIRKIEQKNVQQIPLWIKAHPNCVIGNNRESTPYLKMVLQSTGGMNPDDEANLNKIITNIAREVFINK